MTDVDAVFIATETASHADLTIKAVKAGKVGHFHPQIFSRLDT